MEGGGTETDGQGTSMLALYMYACMHGASNTVFWGGRLCSTQQGTDAAGLRRLRRGRRGRHCDDANAAIREALMEATPAAYGSNRFDYNYLKRESESADGGASVWIDASPLLLLAGCVLSLRTALCAFRLESASLFVRKMHLL